MHPERRMKSRPILFSGPMVRAILSGQKTQTRRVIKQIPTFVHRGHPIMDWPLSGVYTDGERFWLDVQTDVDDNTHEEIRCPYGVPGDQLWVRETFQQIPGARPSGFFSNPELIEKNYWYKATDCLPTWGGERWRPSIHMTRLASRITLEVTNVRVERLQEITEEDAVTEGVQDAKGFRSLWEEINAKRGVCKTCKGHGVIPAWSGSLGGGTLAQDARDCPDCHGAETGYGWDNNPWVWVIEFQRVNREGGGIE